MIIEVDAGTYKKYFSTDPNPFISETFVELNKNKVEKIVRLIDQNSDKTTLGYIAGIKEGILMSPFSAPFGGFHFKSNNIYISEIEGYLKSLQGYIISHKLKGVHIILPPNIYHESFNAKMINSLLRTGFRSAVPEITNWVNLEAFHERFSQKNSREYYRQAIRNELSFSITDDTEEKMEIYDLICQNREKYGRPIYMSYNDIINTSKLWPIDFFKVMSADGTIVASAIFYRSHPKICYAVFWGDNEEGRPLRAMDFLTFNLWSHYKHLGFKYIDLGISTEKGEPNEGLLRFKESHESLSSLRFEFTWYTTM